MKFDITDKKILNALLQNANSSYRTIAKQAGVSLGTVMNRMHKLRDEGIIKKSTVLLDYEKLGYTLGVLIDVRVGHGKLFEVERTISRNPYVFFVYDTTGDFDVSVVAKFPSTKQLDIFVKYIQKMEFVERVHTKLILNVVKEEPPLLR